MQQEDFLSEIYYLAKCGFVVSFSDTTQKTIVLNKKINIFLIK